VIVKKIGIAWQSNTIGSTTSRRGAGSYKLRKITSTNESTVWTPSHPIVESASGAGNETRKHAKQTYKNGKSLRGLAEDEKAYRWGYAMDRSMRASQKKWPGNIMTFSTERARPSTYSLDTTTRKSAPNLLQGCSCHLSSHCA
jgi:hypothetical protein